jgi:hypothetical protein
MFNSDFATELKAGTKDGGSVSTFLLNYAGSGRLARAEYASTPATASHGFALIEWAPPTSIVLVVPIEMTRRIWIEPVKRQATQLVHQSGFPADSGGSRRLIQGRISNRLTRAFRQK